MQFLSRRGLSRRALSWVVLVAIGGCATNVPTVFPMGLEPLEANTALPPASVSGNPRPETLNYLTGATMDEGGREYKFVHARGFVNAPLLRLWTAMRTGAANVDRREVTEFMVIPEEDPLYVQSWKTHTIIRAAALVEFDVRWRHGVAAGTVSAPRVVAARWSKTFGSSFIEIMRGSVSATELGSDVCSVDIVYHLGAFTRTEAHAAQLVQDMFASWVALVHDRPLPTY